MGMRTGKFTHVVSDGMYSKKGQTDRSTKVNTTPKSSPASPARMSPAPSPGGKVSMVRVEKSADRSMGNS